MIQLGAQNVDINVKGAFTGDISSEMLKDFGAKYIIIGHSERRTYHKESDEFVAKKFGALKEAGLVPVLCIGETEAENEAGKTEEVCARQIDAVINALGVEAFNGAVIAYEPNLGNRYGQISNSSTSTSCSRIYSWPHRSKITSCSRSSDHSIRWFSK